MMKSVIVASVLLGLTSQASADSRTVWKGVFVGSMTVALGGGYLWWSGVSDVDDTRQTLCDGGAYQSDPSCSTQVTLTPSQIEALNDNGDRASTRSQVGAATMLVGVGVGAFAFYKGFVQNDKTEPNVVVAPTLMRGGGGAAMQLRW